MFDAIEVVVETGAFEQEQRGGDTAQMQSRRKSFLKGILNHFDGHLGGLGQEAPTIVSGDNKRHIAIKFRIYLTKVVNISEICKQIAKISKLKL